MCRKEFAKMLDSCVFPGMQGGPLMHVIAAKAVSFKEAMSQDFRDYQAQVVKNARVLAASLMASGFRLVSGGTDNHLLLVDLSSKSITGKQAEASLEAAGLTVNKNAIPFDTESRFVTGGIRIGTPAVTTRGLKEPEMQQIGAWINQVLEDPDNSRLQTRVRQEVMDLCGRFPLYPGLDAQLA